MPDPQVARLDDADAEASGHGVEGRPRADDATPDDEDVELFRLQRLDRGVPFVGTQLRGEGYGRGRSHAGASIIGTDDRRRPA